MLGIRACIHEEITVNSFKDLFIFSTQVFTAALRLSRCNGPGLLSLAAV